MEKLMKAYENCILLKVLPIELVETLYKEGGFKAKSYGKNEILHFEGDDCKDLEIIVSGQVVVERIDEGGNLLTVTSFKSGDIIAANLLFSHSAIYPMTVTSKTPSETMTIHKTLVFDLCNKYPDFLNQFLIVISDHSIILGTKIKQHVSRTIREGIITYIQYEYRLQNARTIKMTLTKKAFAERMGISRTSLSRELQKMKKEGLIDYDMRTITILKEAML